MSKKHYVIWKGQTTGIFDSWPQVKSLIDGRSDAQYMGFESKEAAELAFKDTYTRALMNRSLEKSGKAATSSKTAISKQITSKQATSKQAISKPMVSKSTTAKPSAAKSSNRSVTHSDINIYCDGACSPNPGKAGTGIAVYHGDVPTTLYYGLFDANGTNNTAELLGMLEAFKLAIPFIEQKKSVQILSDSKYSIDCITKWAAGWQKKGWKRGKNEEIKNLEIIQECFALYTQLKNNIAIAHVKGHANIQGNELADRMAVFARMYKEPNLVVYPNELDIAAILAMPSG